MSPTPAGASVSTGRGGGAATSCSAPTRVCWRVCRGCVVGVALLGALFSSAFTTLVVAPAVGLFAALQVTVLYSDTPDRPHARRVALLSGFSGALLVPFVLGVVALGMAGVVLAVVLVLIGAPVLMARMSDVCLRESAPPSAGGNPALLRELVRVLPMSALFEEWRSSEAVLDGAGGPTSRAAVIQIRALLLEEMSRRDPAGVASWLDEGADGTPDRHIRGESGPTPG